jgi:hypothetical protein
MRFVWTVGVGLFVVAMLASGCGKSASTPTARVSGIVKSNGQPLSGVQVGFLPENGRPGQGTTDASGRFTITTFTSEDGAIPGKHKVLLSEADKTPPPMPGMPGYAEAMARKKPSRLSAKYSVPSKTPLEATVTLDGKNEFEFDVKN